jgi:hypothetical protein
LNSGALELETAKDFAHVLVYNAFGEETEASLRRRRSVVVEVIYRRVREFEISNVAIPFAHQEQQTRAFIEERINHSTVVVNSVRPYRRGYLAGVP